MSNQPQLQHIREVEEITFSVPWGHIAGKLWGPRTVRPIVCVHGWQDNAGTFDALIPMLPDHISYLTIDLPGHGLSSRYPDGMIYSHIDYLYTLHLISKKFQWEKVSLMAHSMGAIICFLYAAAFPDNCDMVIALDSLKPFITNVGFTTHFLNYGLEEIMIADSRNQEKSEPPSYKYDELIDRLTSATSLSVTRETAPYLLHRAIKASATQPDQYYFTRDSRLKMLHAATLPHETILFLAKHITAPYCFIKAMQSSFKENRKYFDETVDVLKENPHFELHGVDGTHHVHLTDPSKVEEITINVPWGHIACKWWGTKSIRPIVCLHGWQDNAGSFDALIFQLPDHLSYLAVDFPGHGLSSRLPDGMIYTVEIYFYSLMLICKHFEFEKVSLMGHSLGSMIIFLFAATFPDKCDMVIGLDNLKPYNFQFTRMYQFYEKEMDKNVKADIRNRKETEPPSYSYEELLEKVSGGNFMVISRTAAPYLLKRAVAASKNQMDKYYFTRDNRIKASHAPMMAHEVTKMFARKINFPYCSLKPLRTPQIEGQSYHDEIVQIMSANPYFEIHEIDGDHHVHLNEPHKVSGIISTFINRYRPANVLSKL